MRVSAVLFSQITPARVVVLAAERGARGPAIHDRVLRRSPASYMRRVDRHAHRRRLMYNAGAAIDPVPGRSRF